MFHGTQKSKQSILKKKSPRTSDVKTLSKSFKPTIPTSPNLWIFVGPGSIRALGALGALGALRVRGDVLVPGKLGLPGALLRLQQRAGGVWGARSHQESPWILRWGGGDDEDGWCGFS